MSLWHCQMQMKIRHFWLLHKQILILMMSCKSPDLLFLNLSCNVVILLLPQDLWRRSDVTLPTCSAIYCHCSPTWQPTKELLVGHAHLLSFLAQAWGGLWCLGLCLVWNHCFLCGRQYQMYKASFTFSIVPQMAWVTKTPCATDRDHFPVCCALTLFTHFCLKATFKEAKIFRGISVS